MSGCHFTPSRVRKMQNLISEHPHTRAHTHWFGKITQCITQQICDSKLLQTYFTAPVQWGVIRVMEWLWSCYAHCSDLQRCRETITIVWTVSIATLLCRFLFFVWFGEWGAERNEPVLHPVIPADTFIPFDEKCTDIERCSEDDCVKMSMGRLG